jgi:hypothetical protein
LVTEPKRRPSTPAFWLIWSFRFSSFAARSCAFANVSFCAFLQLGAAPSKCLMFSGVARFALPCGMR